MDEYQVIIVGSGPAGSACAKALKDEDIEVLVIEKEELPRPKTCSGILFGQTQILLKEYFGGIPPKEVYCEPMIIKSPNILEWNKEKGFSPYVWELPKDGQSFPEEQYNTWRSKFDYWLLKETGVEYREKCAFSNYSFHNDKVKVEVSWKDKGKTDLYCTYLIGADGGNSRVRMVLDPQWVKKHEPVGVYQAYYRFADMGRLEDAHWYVFFEKSIGETLLCVHRKDEFLTLCVGGFKGRNLKQSMGKFKQFLNENFQVVLLDMERDEGCVSRQSPPSLGEGRVLLTGEAAGMMYLNGEGISAALDSGYRAGKVVAQGIKKGVDVMETYQKETQGILNHMQVCLERTHFLAV